MSRKLIVKKPRKLTPKAAVQAKPSKPVKTGLSKSDPDYFAKIGAISAKKRKLSKAFFSEMAKKSHLHRTEYNGGRRKKDAGDAALVKLDRDLQHATDES